MTSGHTPVRQNHGHDSGQHPKIISADSHTHHPGGREIQLAIDPREHDKLLDFENAVLEQLPHVGNSSTFGCELQFVQKDTHEVLADPIRSKLRANQCFYVIARQCLVEAAHKGRHTVTPKPFVYRLT